MVCHVICVRWGMAWCTVYRCVVECHDAMWCVASRRGAVVCELVGMWRGVVYGVVARVVLCCVVLCDVM